jgi:hypothetical protein
MKCEELRPDYMLYAIGAIEEPERSEIRAHLERGCETCTSGLREAQALTYSMGAGLNGPDPPQDLRGRVLAISGVPLRQPEARAIPRRRSSIWMRPIAAWQGLALAAACVALAFVPAFLWRHALSESNARQAETTASLDREQRSMAALRDRLAGLESDASLRAAPILALELERGNSGEAAKQLAIPHGAGAVVLALPSDLVRQASAADLRDASGQVIRTVSPLPAGNSDATGLTIPAGLLPPGSYSVVLRAGERTLARFPFRVISR